MNRLEYWREVWERKGSQTQGLIAANGYDEGLGKMDTETYLNFTKVAKKELGVKDGDTILDVGCGSGAMLLLLSTRGIEIAGIDYSKAQIKRAKRVVPGMTARVSEANRIPFGDGTFTKVFSCGVFHYFPNLDYATEVLLEMERVATREGKVLVVDIPDLSKGDDRNHLYYPKSFFEDFAERQNMNIKIFNQDVPGYGNSPFRFNVLLWRSS